MQYSLQYLFKNLTQIIHYTRRSADCCNHHAITVYCCKIQAMIDPLCKLPEVKSLYAAISFAEWMQIVDGVIKIGQLTD